MPYQKDDNRRKKPTSRQQARPALARKLKTYYSDIRFYFGRHVERPVDTTEYEKVIMQA